MEVVRHTWNCPLHDTDLWHRLDWLMRNMAHFLNSWIDRFIGNDRIQLEIAKKVVHRLEMARDRRTLSAHGEGL
jgi:hypothetical protein